MDLRALSRLRLDGMLWHRSQRYPRNESTRWIKSLIWSVMLLMRSASMIVLSVWDLSETQIDSGQTLDFRMDTQPRSATAIRANVSRLNGRSRCEVGLNGPGHGFWLVMVQHVTRVCDLDALNTSDVVKARMKFIEFELAVPPLIEAAIFCFNEQSGDLNVLVKREHFF